MGHGILFVTHEHAAARRAILFGVPLAIIKSVSDNSLYSFTGVDVFLRSHLIRRALLEHSAQIAIHAFRVFPDNHKIDILRLDAFQWAKRRIQQLHRTQVRIKIHLESHAEQDFFCMNIGRHARIAKCASQDGIEIARQHSEAIRWNGHSVCEITVSAPIEVVQFNSRATRLDSLDRVGDNFFADPVSWDHGDPFLLIHGRKRYHSRESPRIEDRRVLQGVVGSSALRLRYNRRLGMSTTELHEKVTLVAGAVDMRAEFRALISGCGIHELAQRGKIKLTGRDRVRWLNGMVSNNIRDLAVGQGVYAFLLNAQGHILGDLYSYNRGESLLVETDRAQLEKVLSIFRKYIIMDQVEIEDISEKLSSIGIAGPHSGEVLKAAGFQFSQLQVLQFTDITWQQISVTLVRHDNPLVELYELWSAPGGTKTLREALANAGATPGGEAAVELLRIAAGIPRYGQDIRERDLPQETEQSRALSFTKGCYIGQEIVERIRSRGAVHRTFIGFEIEGRLPTPGAKVQVDGKDVGEITSVASLPTDGNDRKVALGYCRREVGVPGREVMIGDAKARISPLPFAGISS